MTPKKHEMSKTNGKSQANGRNGKQRKSRENLIPWKPGQSGNPNGRAKGPSLKTCVIGELEKRVNNGEITKMQAFAIALVDKCLAGDDKSAKLIADRLWPATQQHDINATVSTTDILDRLDRMCVIPPE